MNNGGDSLAKGAKSAQFSAGGHAKSQLDWDLSVLTETEFLLKYVDTTRARYLQMIDERQKGNA